MTLVRSVWCVCLLYALISFGCKQERKFVSENQVIPVASRTPMATATPIRPLSEIDLTKIGHVAPKGRVQDKEYNHLEAIDQLLAHGAESIPFLIARLDDQRVIKGPVFDYKQKTSVGDVAFAILDDFSADASSKHMIPGSSWDKLFGRLPGPEIPAWQFLDEQFNPQGRRKVKAKWQRIWTIWQDQIFWDEKERCFIVSLIKY